MKAVKCFPHSLPYTNKHFMPTTQKRKEGSFFILKPQDGFIFFIFLHYQMLNFLIKWFYTYCTFIGEKKKKVIKKLKEKQKFMTLKNMAEAVSKKKK